MHFLNGDRIYIKPRKGCHSLEDELDSCLEQLTKDRSRQKVFKLNFFAETGSREEYLELQKKIKRKTETLFNGDVLIALIAQPPVNSKIIAEACFYRPDEWQPVIMRNITGASALFIKGDTQILIGNVQSFAGRGCRANAESAFMAMKEMFDSVKFGLNTIVRQWNYIENILEFEGEKQRYQEFNNVRTEYYGDAFNETGYPAATGIGMNQGGIIVEFIAIKSRELKTAPINNPNQVAAHAYSKNVLVGEECVLKTTPKFERARYIELFGKKLIFISGTASIVGERTVEVGDPAEQTRVTIRNIQQLYSPEVLGKLSVKPLNPKYGHARIYLKNRKDYTVVRRTFKSFYGNLPVVFILADICRNDLLVEIEGKVILE